MNTTIYVYRRVFLTLQGDEEERVDYSPNIEELLVHYRREKQHEYFKEFSFYKGELEPIAEISIRDI